MVFPSQVCSEAQQVVADGLAIEMIEDLDITYEILPDYDETEHVIASWDGDECQYSIAFSKLPPGWLDAGVWIEGFTGDMEAASEQNTFKLIGQGSYTSKGGYDLTYIKLSFVLKGEKEAQTQLVHFITDHKCSYLAFATPVTMFGEGRLVSEVVRILKTSYAPASNVIPLMRKS